MIGDKNISSNILKSMYAFQCEKFITFNTTKKNSQIIREGLKKVNLSTRREQNPQKNFKNMLAKCVLGHSMSS